MTGVRWLPKSGSSVLAATASVCSRNGVSMSGQLSGQECGTPVVIFDGSCKTLISARSEWVSWKGESIAGGPRSTLKMGSGGGMSIGEDGNATRVAGSLLLSPSFAGGGIVLLVSREMRMMFSGS